MKSRSLVVWNLLQTVIQLLYNVVGYRPNRDCIHMLARGVRCSPEELAEELHVRPVLFECSDTRHQKLKLVVTEWLQTDPHASMTKLVGHLINLDELHLVNTLLLHNLTAAGRYDSFHLQMITDCNPRPSCQALLAAAQAITSTSHANIALTLFHHLNCGDSTVLADIVNQSGSVLHQVVAILLKSQMSTEQLVLELRRSPSFRKAAEVLKMSALAELHICVFPNSNEISPSHVFLDDITLYFIANHLTCTSTELSCQLNVFVPLNNIESYFKGLCQWRNNVKKRFELSCAHIELMRHLCTLRQYYATSMVLMMTGSLQRQKTILHRQVRFVDEQSTTSLAFPTFVNNFTPTGTHLPMLLDIFHAWDRSTGELIEFVHEHFDIEVDEVTKSAFGE